MAVTLELPHPGIEIETMKIPAVPRSVELFGHVMLVETYVITGFKGFHAVVALRDTPGKIVAVITTETTLQTLFETALATGNLIAFRGAKNPQPPNPLGGTWSVEVYDINSAILYNTK